MFRSVLLSLCFALPSLAQSPPGYDTAFFAAKEKGKALVIFCQCEGRKIPGAEVVECFRFPDAVGPTIIVGDVETLNCKRFGPTATDADIIAAFPARLSQPKPIREYVREGKVYREYYDTPRYVAVIEERTTYTAPYYGSCANGQCGISAGVGIGYNVPASYSGYPAWRGGFTISPSYAGFQSGIYAGGSCANGNCPAR